MDCLQDYIGLQGCGNETPGSGKYLNDLPGIELRQVQEIANEDEVSFAGIWAKVQKGHWRYSKRIFEKPL